MDNSELVALVDRLRAQPYETEWLEFKRDYAEPQMIGENISALANAALLENRRLGYLIFGVDDATHDVVGTQFNPYTTKAKRQDLQLWITSGLNPNMGFDWYVVQHPQGRLVVCEINAARGQPVEFYRKAKIRVGSNTTDLSRHPMKAREIWSSAERTSFEEGLALEGVTDEDVLRFLDCPAYFELLQKPLPLNRDGILQALKSEELILRNEQNGWNITNLGAILFAKRLDNFRSLRRKAVRVIRYRGNRRTDPAKEAQERRGYASSFNGLVEYVNGLLPINEVIKQALRESMPMYPELAVRELAANMLIHQDFSATGAGPMVEIFRNRVEITNPGQPLVDTQRFVGTPPKSRNETLAALMRRFGVCEERGSGIGKVITEVEAYQLPAPLFETPGEFTRATLFAPRPFNAMDKASRIRACYQHACLCRIAGEAMTNSTLRKRFGITEGNAAIASRLIRETIGEGLIIAEDPNVGTKFRRYLPFWVLPERETS